MNQQVEMGSKLSQLKAQRWASQNKGQQGHKTTKGANT